MAQVIIGIIPLWIETFYCRIYTLNDENMVTSLQMFSIKEIIWKRMAGILQWTWWLLVWEEINLPLTYAFASRCMISHLCITSVYLWDLVQHKYPIYDGKWMINWMSKWQRRQRQFAYSTPIRSGKFERLFLMFIMRIALLSVESVWKCKQVLES